MNARVMRRAMEFARSYDLPVIQHCEDLNLSAGGDMHEGAQSVRWGCAAFRRRRKTPWWRGTCCWPN
jgi:dihydroorotase-like cyclic amidohydrolase